MLNMASLESRLMTSLENKISLFPANPANLAALAWLACLLCPALAWSGLGLSCLPALPGLPALPWIAPATTTGRRNNKRQVFPFCIRTAAVRSNWGWQKHPPGASGNGQGCASWARNPKGPKSHLFVTNRVAIQPFWTLLIPVDAKFRPRSRQIGPTPSISTFLGSFFRLKMLNKCPTSYFL